MRKIEGVSVAVVGGAGFLGSHLVDHLIDDRGCAVTVIDNLVAGRREFVHPRARFIHHDITGSESFLRDVFRGVEYVFNYAAIPFVPSGFDRPIETFNVTATAALKVLTACHDAKVEGVLQVSSAEIYGNNQGQIKETDPIEPHSTYGVSKTAADWLVQARWREVRQQAIAMRQFNCYGPRPTWPYVIPEIISQLLHGPAVRLGNNSRRDFQFCNDAARMAVELLEHGEWGSVYNMGSEKSIAIHDLARLIGELMGHSSIEIVTDLARVRRKEVEIWQLCSDNAKLFGAIKYRPETPLREGLLATIEWFRKNAYEPAQVLSKYAPQTSHGLVCPTKHRSGHPDAQPTP